MYKLDKPARMHWDRIAINPKDANGNPKPPSTAETFCLGQPLNTCGATGGTATPTQPGGGTNTPTTTPTSGVTPTPFPNTVTVTFEDKSGQNQALNGQYPTGLIDWGTSQWWHSAPYEQLTTKNFTFNGNAGVTSASFTLLQPRKLTSVQAYNGGNAASTVTITCAGNPTKTQVINANTLVTITTGWTNACTSITLASSNGWDTNFDNLVLDMVTGTNKPGDINRDGSVNILDYTILFDNYAKQPIPDPRADLNNDGKVNVIDYSLLFENYGT